MKLRNVSKNIYLPVPGRSFQTGHGFFDWFSSPSEVAHLATVKEQSREKYCIIIDQLWCLFLFSESSIKQFFKVLAMSILTTNDLELGIYLLKLQPSVATTK